MSNSEREMGAPASIIVMIPQRGEHADFVLKEYFQQKGLSDILFYS